MEESIGNGTGRQEEHGIILKSPSIPLLSKGDKKSYK